MQDILKQNIIKDFRLDELPEEKRNDILVKMTEVILKRITLAIWEILSPEDRDELEELLASETKDEIAILNFFQTKVSDLDVIMAKEVEDFRQESLEAMKDES